MIRCRVPARKGHLPLARGMSQGGMSLLRPMCRTGCGAEDAGNQLWEESHDSSTPRRRAGGAHPDRHRARRRRHLHRGARSEGGAAGHDRGQGPGRSAERRPGAGRHPLLGRLVRRRALQAGDRRHRLRHLQEEEQPAGGCLRRRRGAPVHDGRRRQQGGEGLDPRPGHRRPGPHRRHLQAREEGEPRRRRRLRVHQHAGVLPRAGARGTSPPATRAPRRATPTRRRPPPGSRTSRTPAPTPSSRSRRPASCRPSP